MAVWAAMERDRKSEQKTKYLRLGGGMIGYDFNPADVEEYENSVASKHSRHECACGNDALPDHDGMCAVCALQDALAWDRKHPGQIPCLIADLTELVEREYPNRIGVVK